MTAESTDKHNFPLVLFKISTMNSGIVAIAILLVTIISYFPVKTANPPTIYGAELGTCLRILDHAAVSEREKDFAKQINAGLTKHLLSIMNPNHFRHALLLTGVLLKEKDRKTVDMVLPVLHIENHHERINKFFILVTKRNDSRTRTNEKHLNATLEDLWKVYDKTKHENFGKRGADIYMEISKLRYV